MLYKFKSKATGDLIMLEPQGRQILKIVGKDPDPKGIIEPHEMLAAIEALKAAVVREQEQRTEAEQAAQANTRDAATDDGSHNSGGGSGAGHISLKQRVVPFIDMLQRAHAEGKDIVWGV